MTIIKKIENDVHGIWTSGLYGTIRWEKKQPTEQAHIGKPLQSGNYNES